MNSPYSYSFQTGDGHNKALLGSKGANLCLMTQLGLNVPPGFVISTAACLTYLNNQQLPAGLMVEVSEQIQAIEQETGKSFGGSNDPLLVSVRSGAAVSMPGMMDTILNLGLNRQTVTGLIEMTENPRFVYDAYRRFIELFGKIVLGIAEDKFTLAFNAVKRSAGIKADAGLNGDQLQDICEMYLKLVQEQTGQPFPEDVYLQLELAIQAVFNSWQGKRALDYRQQFHIGPEIANGTAVNIVTMVFGNMGDDCATGVGFTRNPSTGADELFGEYLINAQGEDVVAGIRTPKPISDMRYEMPEQYQQLLALREKLEAHYQEVQDFEYTIERGVLYCLQTRKANMTATAMVRSSLEMVKQALINQSQALLRINPESLEQLLHPQLEAQPDQRPIAQGLPASPGAACGHCVFDADSAMRMAKAGKAVILLREETRSEDIHGFFAAQGILTSRGGKTSHAAVVARGMGKACVAGAESIKIDVKARLAIVADIHLKEGDLITIDGSSGAIYLGKLATITPVFSKELKTLLNWADEIAHLKVYANVDTPETAALAASYGAKGIGLCRTERMFNAADRLPLMLDMILANNSEQREAALAKLFPIQRDDFLALFTAMAPHPVIVRLLDPPMHEFLPNQQQLLSEIDALQHYLTIVKGQRVTLESLLAGTDLPAPFNLLTEDTILETIAKKKRMLSKLLELQEVNPMLGHRGVRLGMSYPEIYTMQIRSILEAAACCIKQRIQVKPEIMVPQVITAQELKKVKQLVSQIHQEVEDQYRIKLRFKFGTMIETVRACTRADHLAAQAEFFSFGTNDLTQATFSFSREDAENKFLPLYEESGLLENNPFETLDREGVGKLMQMAVSLGRQQRPDLQIGICGEHGGHPASIGFCQQLGLDYVSCSAHRIPIARLAAAQASLLARKAV